jgi:2-C-methyl-D-erythritol 4-phosphate cytidylyltransferase
LVEPSTGAIIVAAGSGRRFDPTSEIPKQFRVVRGKTLLEWAIQPFLSHPAVGAVVVVLSAEIAKEPPAWLGGPSLICVEGGAERVDSVRSGLESLPGSVDRVLVHDGARPFPTLDLIDRVLAAPAGEGVVPGLRISDTVKEVDADGMVIRTVPRESLWRVQTPQAFPAARLREVHLRARGDDFVPSDDAALFERYGYPVRVVEGDDRNIKVTTRADLALAEFMARRLPGSG